MTVGPSTGRQSVSIAFLDDYQSVAATAADWSIVPGGVEIVSITEHLDDVDALARHLAGARVVVAMRERTPIGADLLDRLPDLALLVTTGPSNAVVDVDAARERGVEVCGTGGYLSPTSEHTWALILALARHIPADDRAIRAGRWQERIGIDLAGKTLGIVGLGRLGTMVAEVGRAFGMDIVAWSQNLTAEVATERGARRVDRAELFSTADVVSVHLVLSERTRGLIGADDLRRMKPTAFLVNTSRGAIIDEGALVDALTHRRIAGAGLDVFEVEPLPAEHPLRQLDNTVLTPHTGYVTDGLYALFFREIAEDIAAFLAGAPIRLVQQ